MVKTLEILFYIMFTLLGGLLGHLASRHVTAIPSLEFQGNTLLLIKVGLVLVCALTGFVAAPFSARLFFRIVNGIVSALQKLSVQEVFSGTVGLVVGLIVASLFIRLLIDPWFEPLGDIPLFGLYLKPFVSLFLAVFFIYLGIFVTVRLPLFHPFGSSLRGGAAAKGQHVKILDTSVIIDGRIADVCATGFVDGTIVIPKFVLDELQHIADSPDVLRRNRGRRGLDVLNRMRKENVRIQMYDRDVDEPEVDAKLVRLAKELNGAIVTNDYNLNKVAEFQGVKILNINELANAMKPVVLPGEDMHVQIIKEGKEQGQGVAYLDDGTMVVVEGGRKYIGDTLDVTVTSVLQTVAGKMIFAKLK